MQLQSWYRRRPEIVGVGLSRISRMWQVHKHLSMAYFGTKRGIFLKIVSLPACSAFGLFMHLWVGGICLQCLLIDWSYFKWSSNSSRKVLPHQCWFSWMYADSYPISRSTLSSGWMGSWQFNLFNNRLILIILSPSNKKELFNLCHASAQNVIKKIFGVLKKWFHILLLPPEYTLEIQAWIPATLCAIHNFIWEHDPSEREIPGGDIPSNLRGGRENTGGFDDTNDELDVRRDRIADVMWSDYQRILEERGLVNSTDKGEILDINDVTTDEDAWNNDLSFQKWHKHIYWHTSSTNNKDITSIGNT